MLRNAKTNFLRFIGYLSFTKDCIKLDSSPTLALALLQNCLYYLLLASRLSYLAASGTTCIQNMFRPIKNSGDILSKLKSKGFRATSLSTHDFSTLYTTLPHNLI